MNLFSRNRNDFHSTLHRTVLCICMTTMILSFSGCTRDKETLFLDPKAEEDIVVVTEEEVPLLNIIVEIKGEVLDPGVYTLPGDSRLNDLVQVSGGTTPSANLRNVNLAMKIEDGQSFYIPSVHEEEQEITVGEESQGDGKIDLNKATREELMSVTGIGPSTADNILAYREENGKFTSVDELVQVNRIGDKTLEKIRDFFIVK